MRQEAVREESAPPDFPSKSCLPCSAPHDIKQTRTHPCSEAEKKTPSRGEEKG